MALELIIFDCDGVLIESVDAKTRAFATIAKPYGQKAVDALVSYHLEQGGVSRVEKLNWFFETVLERAPEEGEQRRLLDEFVELSLQRIYTALSVPGIWDVLERWHGVVPMYVASGAPHLELTNVLKQHAMARFFTGIYGSPPGKTTLLRGILAEENIEPYNAVMVGDGANDMYAAEATRTRFYGRGEYFRHSDYPWHKDLTRLNGYLEELYSE